MKCPFSTIWWTNNTMRKQFRKGFCLNGFIFKNGYSLTLSIHLNQCMVNFDIICILKNEMGLKCWTDLTELECGFCFKNYTASIQFPDGIWKKRATTVSKCKAIMSAGNFLKLTKFLKISHIKCSCFCLKLANDLLSEESRIRNM